MAIAVDFERQRGDGDRMIQRLERHRGRERLEQGVILGDQGSFGFAFVGVGKEIKSGPPQKAQASEHAKKDHHPRSKATLAQLPGSGIASRKDWRRHMEKKLRVAFELLADCFDKSAVGKEAGSLIAS